MNVAILEKGNDESPEPPGCCSTRSFWWERTDLRYRSNLLCFGETPLADLVKETKDRPGYVYRPARAAEKAAMLRAALPELTILYAVKANRHPAILKQMFQTVDGIDVCSPNEAKLALASSFREDKISYTGTSLSESDLDFLTSHPGIHVNVDSLSCMRRLLKRCPGRTIGVRVNPETGIGYRNENRLVYSSSERPGKFGLLTEQLTEADALAQSFGSRINTVHWHVGCGWLDGQLGILEEILHKAVSMAAMIPGIERINLGGGLGVPFRSDDALLSLSRWAEIVRKTIAGRWKIVLEPGSFLVQDAGILLAQVNTVERKRQWAFAGVNAGFNLAMEPVFYGMPLEPVFLTLPESGRKVESLSIAGNINEAHDLLVKDFDMPVPQEGEWLGFLNAGAYAAAMASNHCLRGDFWEIALP